MRALLLLLLAPVLAMAALGTALPRPARAEQSLYDKLGAREGVARIVGGALALYFTDPRLRNDFDNINRSWLQPRFESFLCHVAGGPCLYKGRSMAASHKGLHISQARFNAVVEDLQTAMDRANIPFRTQNRLLARLAPIEHDIVTQ
jgi:hemoglobin